MFLSGVSHQILAPAMPNILRSSIRLGRRWSELIVAPTASIGDVQSCRLGPISVVANLLAVGVSLCIKGQAMMSRHRAFGIFGAALLADRFEQQLPIGNERPDLTSSGDQPVRQ
jgi:hypothetical protein